MKQRPGQCPALESPASESAQSFAAWALLFLTGFRNLAALKTLQENRAKAGSVEKDLLKLPGSDG
jgi:hypothetical protein